MVEDSAADAELILHKLYETGCHLEYELVDTAHDTRRALGEKQWDVILCDYSMPYFDPYKVLDILRETELDIPLIVISGKIGEEEAIKLLKAGCHDCIMKSDLRRLPDVIYREIKEAIVREENRILNKKLQKYQILCDAANDMMLFMDAAGNILDANLAAIKCYGYSFEEFLAKNILDLRHLSNKESVNTQMETALAGDIVFEAIHYRKDNTPFFAEVSSQEILLNGQKALFSIVRDITERKRDEAELQYERNMAQIYLDTAGVMIVALDKDGKVSLINREGCEILNVAKEDVLGKDWFDSFVPDSALKDVKQVFDIIMAGEIKTEQYHENAVITADGEERIILWHNNPSRDTAGNIIGVLSSGTDATERKQAEKALAESENLFRTSFESATDGIIMFGKNGRYIKVNDRACELWGYTREELLQLHFNDITYKEDQGISTDLYDKMISGGLNNAAFEKRYIKKDGTVIWAYVSTSAIRDEINNIKYFISYIQDITDSKAVTERINGVLEGTIETLARVVEARDPYTSGHQKRVAEIAVAIAENMGLSKEQVHGLYLASIVHDLGKMQVPAEILSKPGKLTYLEFEMIKCHPETAYDLLKDIDFPWPVAEIIYQHHERIDGSGYPRKLKGDSMSVEAKILGVADVYEAMSSHRPYRAAFPKDTALAEIEKNKGVLYDPDVVEAFLKVLKDT